MSQPNPQIEANEHDYELHIQAGLQPFEKDEDGDMEWMGTREAWEMYELLVNSEE